MKRIASIIIILLLLFDARAFAFGETLFDIRNKFFCESKELKSALNEGDAILMNSMWDTCLMTILQLDAYFSMLGIFNTIGEGGASGASVDYLSNWLSGIKKTIELNVKSIEGINVPVRPVTQVHMERMKGYFGELNSRIESEIDKLALIKKAGSAR